MPHSADLTWFDAHLDLAYLAASGRDLTAGAAPANQAVTFSTLGQGNVCRMLATIFVQRRITSGPREQQAIGPWCYDTIQEAYQCSVAQLQQYGRWHAANNLHIFSQAAAPFNATPHTPRPTASIPQAIILLEGAAGLREVHDLDLFYQGGVRVLALTWVDGNQWSGGDQSGGDITPAGRQLLAQADSLNMVHDVSHLSERAFWTLLESARRPAIASHSNCRSLLPGKQHPERHLSDRQIAALVAAGGVIGINLFGKFLCSNGRAAIQHVVDHIGHITNVTGRGDCIGLGSDMDGGFASSELPEGIAGPADLYKIADALAAANYSDAFIHGFAHKNWDRFFATAL
ncbi:MAG: dipeptidase [Phycisphaerae bacterium]